MKRRTMLQASVAGLALPGLLFAASADLTVVAKSGKKTFLHKDRVAEINEKMPLRGKWYFGQCKEEGLPKTFKLNQCFSIITDKTGEEDLAAFFIGNTFTITDENGAKKFYCGVSKTLGFGDEMLVTFYFREVK